MLEGVDVSHHQGSIDWRAVAKSGRSFAFVRATDGLHFTDPLFRANWAGARAAGLVRGAYQFFRPTDDPVAQANLLLSMAPPATGDLPLTLDVETLCAPPAAQCAGGGVSTTAAADGVAAWVERITSATGTMPILYVSPGFWSTLPPRGVERRTIPWIATWYVNLPATPAGWKQWAFWQYTDKGNVPGIKGQVDLDRFGGNALELRLLTHGAKRLATEFGVGTLAILAGLGLGAALLLSPPSKEVRLPENEDD